MSWSFTFNFKQMICISINNKFVLYYFRWKVYRNYEDNFVWPKFFNTIFDASVFVGFLRA